MADDSTTSSSTTNVVFAGPMGTGTVSIIDKKTGRLRRRFSKRTAEIEFDINDIAEYDNVSSYNDCFSSTFLLTNGVKPITPTPPLQQLSQSTSSFVRE